MSQEKKEKKRFTHFKTMPQAAGKNKLTTSGPHCDWLVKGHKLHRAYLHGACSPSLFSFPPPLTRWSPPPTPGAPSAGGADGPPPPPAVVPFAFSLPAAAAPVVAAVVVVCPPPPDLALLVAFVCEVAAGYRGTWITLGALPPLLHSFPSYQISRKARHRLSIFQSGKMQQQLQILL